MGEVAVVTTSGGGGGVVQENREERDEKAELVPRMVLRVLLVEADDSTRHIISALLRKCSYKVAAVPDGLMAWETLKGRPHNIDLILTEVELPSISGYALLTLIMEHDVCKNIPVIMMSSQDSISTVFNCMLKGAADFLIKPVRRNELKNLWQHVWRRQALTAGHIPSNSLIALHRVEATSENNSASDHSSDCATSWHKRMECSDERNDGQDAQPKSRTSSDPGNMEKENQKECIKLDRRSAVPEDKDRDWSTRKRPVEVSSSEAHNPAVLQHGEEHGLKLSIQHERTIPENASRDVDAPRDHNDEYFGSSGRVIDLIGAFDNVPKDTYGHGSIKDSNNNFEFPSQLELSLRRFFPNGSKIQGTVERHALNHSNASAFSRYNGKTLQPLFPTSTSNCLEIKDDPRKSLELSSDQRSQNVNSVPQQHGSDLNGSQENMTKLVIGQSGKTELACPNPQKVIPVSGMRVDSICSAHGHVFSPSCYAQNGLPTWSPKLGSQREQSPYPAATSIHSNPENQDSDRNNRQSVDTATYSVDQQNIVEHVDKLKHESSTGGQSASSSMCNSVADHNNSSAYGSFSCKSDGNATVAPSEGPAVPESTTDGGVLACDVFKGMDSYRSSQREAALTKFRLKRKDRCFEKKVRYQSRKRLAEMRPRVKGQFVRQVQNDESGS